MKHLHFFSSAVLSFLLLFTLLSFAPAAAGAALPDLPVAPLSEEDVTLAVALIDSIGEVTFTADCKARIDAAQEAWDRLSFSEKLRNAGAGARLTAAQTAYRTLATAAQVKVSALEARINLLLTKIEYSEEFKAELDAVQAEYDALTPEEKALMSDQTKAMLPILQTAYKGLEAEAKIKAAAVKARIALIGNVELTDACKNRIDAANEAYEALTPGQRTLVDNADVLLAALDEYARLAEDKRYRERFAQEFDSVYQVRFAEDYPARFARDFDSVYAARFEEDYRVRFAEDYAAQSSADLEQLFALRFDSLYQVRFAEDYAARFEADYEARFAADYAERDSAGHTVLSIAVAGSASVKTAVRKGLLQLDVRPLSEGWEAASVMVDGEDRTALVENGLLSIEVEQPTAVSVAYRWADEETLYEEEDLPAGLTTADGLKVYWREGQLAVESAGRTIRVFTAQGALLTSRTPEADIALFTLPAGTYIVQVGREAVKVCGK